MDISLNGIPTILLKVVLTLLSILGSLFLMWAVAVSRQVVTHTEDIAIIKAETAALKETVERVDNHVLEIREALVPQQGKPLRH